MPAKQFSLLSRTTEREKECSTKRAKGSTPVLREGVCRRRFLLFALPAAFFLMNLWKSSPRATDTEEAAVLLVQQQLWQEETGVVKSKHREWKLWDEMNVSEQHE